MKLIEIENIVKNSLDNPSILDFNQWFVLVKFNKFDRVEYATFKYNDNSIYSGNYFIEDDAEELARTDFYKRTREYL